MFFAWQKNKKARYERAFLRVYVWDYCLHAGPPVDAGIIIGVIIVQHARVFTARCSSSGHGNKAGVKTGHGVDFNTCRVR